MGVYFALGHKNADANKENFKLLKKRFKRVKKDGLNNLNFKLISKEENSLFTNYTVWLNDMKWN